MIRSARDRQSGFSLVELMVALAIGLILLAGILQILLGNRASFSKQQALAGLQENGRLVSFVIDNVVAHAGYRVKLLWQRSADADNIIFPARADNTHNLSFAAGAFVAGAHPGARESDAVRLRFQANGGVHDCQGSAVGGPTDADVALGDFALMVDADAHTLQCVIYDSSGNVRSSQPLVDNVDLLKVRYGLDTDSNNAVDTYTSTLDSNAARQVRSLRLQLLLETDANVLNKAVAHTYVFADGTSMQFDDRRARELVDQTVALRNTLP